VSRETFYETFCEIWFMKINDDSADCFIENLWMHIISRNTARELNDKRTKKGKQKLLKAEQFLRIACSQEKAYEASEKQRRDCVTRNEIECAFVSRATNESRHIISLRFSIKQAAIFTVFMFTRFLRNSISRWLSLTWSSFTSINHDWAHVSASSHHVWIMLAKNAQRSYSATAWTICSRRIAKSNLHFKASWLKISESRIKILLKFSVMRNLSNERRKLENGWEQSRRRRKWHQ